MPNVFLSPSLQPFNTYINGGNEAEIMGYLADAIEPYLTINNIAYTRSKMPNTLQNAVNQSNQGNYDLHLALHSNASPEDRKGEFRGIQGYYYPTSAKGKQASQDLVDALKPIYPLPDLVYTVPSTTIFELRRTKAPAVLMEIGYHDNLQDAIWIKNNIQNIASALAKGLTNYFNLPFKEVCTQIGNNINSTSNIRNNVYISIRTNDGSLLNIRSEPNTQSQILGQIPSGQKALLLEKLDNGWAKIRYNVIEGYSFGDYLFACVEKQQTVAKITTDGSNLNLRSQPNLNAHILARIPNNATVTVLEQAGAWYKVKYMGVTGYVLGDFLTF